MTREPLAGLDGVPWARFEQAYALWNADRDLPTVFGLPTNGTQRAALAD